MTNPVKDLKQIINKLYNLPVEDIFPDNDATKCVIYLSINKQQSFFNNKNNSTSYYIEGELLIRATEKCKLERGIFINKWKQYVNSGQSYANGFSPYLSENGSTQDVISIEFNYFSPSYVVTCESTAGYIEHVNIYKTFYINTLNLIKKVVNYKHVKSK